MVCLLATTKYETPVIAIPWWEFYIKGEYMNSSIESVTLEEEATEIEHLFCKMCQSDKTLTEARTMSWVQLGKRLIRHRQNIESQNIVWTTYAINKFPFLKERRRQQCMALAEHGDRIIPYYYMGIDRLYDIFNKLRRYHKDLDFDYICKKRYPLLFEEEPQSDSEKATLNSKIDVIRNFFSLKKQVKRTDLNRESVVEVLETGYLFTDNDIEYLNKKSVSNVDEYLQRLILTGSSSAYQSPTSHSRIGIYIIFSQLLETVQQYSRDKKFPEYLTMDLFNTVIEELTNFRDEMFKNNKGAI